jgi:hypothetical protein
MADDGTTRQDLDVDVWFVFVNSEANIADWPSRGLVAFAVDLGASRIEGADLSLPSPQMWGSVDAAARVIDDLLGGDG